MIYETVLFEIAPWTKEVMGVAKSLNNQSLMRGRTGWINRGVNNPESIYEHICKVGLAAWYLLGTNDAIATGIVHDFPEILEHDYVPGQINAQDKKIRESEAMKKLSNMLPDGNYWFNAWLDFENDKRIRELDVICPSIQAVDYIIANNGRNLDEFYPYTRKKLTTPQLVSLLDDICLKGVSVGESAYTSYFKGLELIKL